MDVLSQMEARRCNTPSCLYRFWLLTSGKLPRARLRCGSGNMLKVPARQLHICPWFLPLSFSLLLLGMPCPSNLQVISQQTAQEPSHHQVLGLLSLVRTLRHTPQVQQISQRTCTERPRLFHACKAEAQCLRRRLPGEGQAAQSDILL